jgi:hypothetical protein
MKNRKKTEKSEQNIRYIWGTIKWTNTCIVEVTDREERKKSGELIGRNNYQRLTYFDERHDYEYPRNSINFK